MTRHFTLVLSLLFCLSAMAQPNQKDAAGKRQGKWSLPHENSTVPFYVGEFKDDIRVGQWTYYYVNGNAKAIMTMSESGKKAQARLYSEGRANKPGVLMAEGIYQNEKKDSVWTYYFEDGRVSAREHWSNGLRQGAHFSYFKDGGLAEEYACNEGLKEGVFKEYHSPDVIRREGNYQGDEYEGQMTYYFPNGRKEIEGKYVNGRRESTWRYYNKDGSIHYQIVYRYGTMVKEKKENGVFREFSPDNIIISEITYKNGLKEGPFKVFHNDGKKVLKEVVDERTGERVNKEVTVGNKLKMSGQYKNDALHGEIIEYNQAGIKISSKRYIEGQLQ